MHQLIRILTTAYDNDDATGVAKGLFEGRHPSLIPPFDYGMTMAEGGRWSDSMPDVVQETGSIQANSEDGMELIEDGWTSQQKSMKRNWDALVTAIEDRGVTFEQAMNDAMIEDVDVEQWNPLGLAQDEDDLTSTYSTHIRYAMHTLGRYEGPNIYLYDEYGSGIRKPSRYEQYIECIENGEGMYEELGEDLQWFVVPVDVHY